jgi:trans-2,3-dihydro-3-hydroxyanthranilate isomerase
VENLKFYIVDVFAETKYGGNPLAVVIAAHLTPAQMQQIAQEMNYSETTFILSEQPIAGAYPVRIFTPTQELPFAGHPTLGTAFIIQQVLIQAPVESVVLALPVGRVAVRWQQAEASDRLWMQQPSPTFGPIFDIATLAPVLNLDQAEFDPHLPIQTVSTGLPFIIVPLRQRLPLQQTQINRDRLFHLIAHTDAKALLLFCPAPADPANDLVVRAVVDGLGIPSDPATGSANGCLAAYLVKHQYLGQLEINLRVEQGEELHRPSLLLLKAAQTADDITVMVGGQVILVARGELV